jgi:hypothetical protein
MQALTPELRQAFTGGLRDAHTQLEARAALASRPGQMFGTREFFNGDYALRALGAKAGLYGSSREEALYPLYLADAQGEALDGRRRRYLLRFDPGGLPPVNAFWSLTLYDLPGQRLVPNPLNRHAIGSRALRDLKFDADGGLTIHIQAEPPGPEREVNWLPAPDGPFMLSMRLYWPKEQVLRGEWKPPAVQRVR